MRRPTSPTSRPAPWRPLVSAVDAGNFSVTLLDGVTGSGKTEVYFEAVARALEAGGQALIMLPEIALTSQFLDRFERRFGVAPVEWHSALSPAERGRIWKGVARGDVRCVVGARSALFLPFCTTRPYRHRRGARPGIQAGRPRPLSGARHGRRARQPRQVPGRARVRDAVDRKPRQRARRTLSPRRACPAAFPASRCRTYR